MKENLLIVEDEYVLASDLQSMLEQAGYHICAIVDTIADAKVAVLQYQPTWVLLDIMLQDDAMGTELAAFLTEKNVGFIYVSASTDQQILELAKQTHPDGFLVKPVRERDLLMMLDIARSKRKQHTEVATQRELAVQQQLRQIVDSNGSNEQAFEQIAAIFQSMVPFDFMHIEFLYPSNPQPKGYSFVRVGFNEYQVVPNHELPVILGKALLPKQAATDNIYNQVAFEELMEQEGLERTLHQRFDINACLQHTIPLAVIAIRLSFYNKRTDAYTTRHVSLLAATQKAFADLFTKLHTTDINIRVKNNTQKPVPAATFVGNSPVLMSVLDDIETVADTPVSVLILGESGTGKELVAKNIHRLSNRSSAPFVVVNCAALPAELIESELFGHEKGAFTGAVDKRTGKFELANGGTLFLDEIGELPMALQGKLLRVLQEKELEHVGGNKVVKVDVRIIAATNRNLEKEVAEGNFRLDLFFRLNVYPITLPPLRERKEDIPLLGTFFLEEAARRFGKTAAPALSAGAIRKLQRYQWPGNIRELENLMERMVIRFRQPVILESDLPELNNISLPGEQDIQTLVQREAEHIIMVLKKCNGKIFGKGGAAEILGLPSSTLTSRIKKLGIKKDLYFRRSS